MKRKAMSFLNKIRFFMILLITTAILTENVYSQEEERVHSLTGILMDFEEAEIQKNQSKLFTHKAKIFFGKMNESKYAEFLFQGFSTDKSVWTGYKIGDRLEVFFPMAAYLDYSPEKPIPLYKVQKKNPNLERILVYKKEVKDLEIQNHLQTLNCFYTKGMDSSKGKKYYYKTGKKYILRFLTKESFLAFPKLQSKNPLIYEIYIQSVAK
ncbi:MAG TPA: hypothetical protein PLS71_07280 [Leptospiraceae bacterium]|nr:hypothetical protein [Leptospiraceae bacterium]